MLESRIYLTGAIPGQFPEFERALVRPIYGTDIEVSKERESGERYFREKLNGTFTFQDEAYTAIRSNNLNVMWTMEVVLHDTITGTEKTFGVGTFTKDKCSFNDDDKTCSIEVTTKDRYSKLLAHLDDKFNLVKIAPKISSVTMTKRAILQLYMIGDTKITNVLGNISYEVDAEEVTDEEKLTGDGNDDYHFAEITSTGSRYLKFASGADLSPYEDLEDYIEDTYYPDFTQVPIAQNFYYYNANHTRIVKGTWSPQSQTWRCTFVNSSDIQISFSGFFCFWSVTPRQLDLAVYRALVYLQYPGIPPRQVNLNADFRRTKIYSRILLDVNDGGEVPAGVYKRSTEDIAAANLNYRYVKPISILGMQPLSTRVVESSQVQDEPTEYGIDTKGKYFVQPQNTIANGHILPVAWNMWAPNSFWFESDPTLHEAISEYDCPFVLKDAYQLKDVISKILTKMDVGVRMGYSSFLEQPLNPVSDISQSLYITPITNVKRTYYKQAAQRGDISLKDILEMLKTCFQCYWYIDNYNNLIIEHISWFKNGGSYQSDQRNVLLDTTTLISPRNRKPWSFGQNSFKYDTDSLPRRYEFAWPSDATEPFNGISYDVKQTFLENNNAQSNRVNNFFSDLDLIVATPDSVSDDLFALIAADNGVVPIVQQRHYENFRDDYRAYLQNGWVSFDYLFRYYLYDLSGNSINPPYEGTIFEPIAISRNKEQIGVEFPYSIDLFSREGLIKTGIGEGEIKKLSLNLSSLMAQADLEYDTE